MIVRGVIALVAVLVVAWLAVLERDVRLLARAHTASAHNQPARADDLLRRATFLNPNEQATVSRALIAAGQGEHRRAVDLAARAARAEPQNIAAWSALLLVARGHDPTAQRRALAAVQRLDPLSAPRR